MAKKIDATIYVSPEYSEPVYSHGHTLCATRSQLIDAFGEPTDNGDTINVNFNWDFCIEVLDNEIFCCLHDWQNSGVSEFAAIDWVIRADNKFNSNITKEILNSVLSSNTYNVTIKKK